MRVAILAVCVVALVAMFSRGPDEKKVECAATRAELGLAHDNLWSSDAGRRHWGESLLDANIHDGLRCSAPISTLHCVSPDPITSTHVCELLTVDWLLVVMR